MTQSNIYPLLESVIQDNHTYKFPIESIRKQLLNMLLTQDEFEYFMMESYRSIKRDYGFIYGHILLTTIENNLNLSNLDVHTLSEGEYQEKISNLIETLENLSITRVEKNSPDGEMLSVMRQ